LLPNSTRAAYCKALQQPNYVDQGELEAALAEIQNRPPLVFAGEARNLQAQLANAAAGNAFVLFGGGAVQVELCWTHSLKRLFFYSSTMSTACV
jgi:3-deoxy-D-arabino-heptulosonate 7-phosphate (DAHP) synthase class II